MFELTFVIIITSFVLEKLFDKILITLSAPPFPKVIVLNNIFMVITPTFNKYFYIFLILKVLFLLTFKQNIVNS